MPQEPLTPQKVLNKAYRKQKPHEVEIERFRANLFNLLKELDEGESEEHLKNDVRDFLNDTWYKGEHLINTKGRTDLVVHHERSGKSPVGVLMEVKKPDNREMVTHKNLNTKALQELLLYYLRERVDGENKDIKHLVVTNVYEWFIFDAGEFYGHFYSHKKLRKQYEQWAAGQLEGKDTSYFYTEIAKPFIEEVQDKLQFTWFDLRNYEKELKKEADSRKLIALYKILSPVHLLNRRFANDSNSLNRQFYHELLHIIGLEEVKEKGKRVIQRKEKGYRNEGSLLENAINIIDESDRLSILEKPLLFGLNDQERLYNVALELCITWVNRVLFLKLLESQLIVYHQGDEKYRFLDEKTIPNFDALNSLFFGVLAKQYGERNERYQEKYAYVPYLNSSLFEPSDIERVLTITMLNNNLELDIYPRTVLTNDKDKRLTGKKDTLSYLFEFLDAYDFSSEGKEDVQRENKSLINASVLGLIFEKINGYKDGSFYTPGFITMYMCRETIRRALVQKFNEQWGWNCMTFEYLKEDLHQEIRKSTKGRSVVRKEANDIINSLKICDPAVGSGHFLVSALNELITIKSELNVLVDRQGEAISNYTIEIENDELMVTDLDGQFFSYLATDKSSQKLQETLFHEKQTIIENCLFGVDINPNSVKICRLRLWIELLKNAYYKSETELETLPNIDINIKCGNSLISRFDLHVDLKQALRKSKGKWTIESYKLAVHSYHHATSKDQKRQIEKLIDDIKTNFQTEIANYSDPRKQKVARLGEQLFKLTGRGRDGYGMMLFEPEGDYGKRNLEQKRQKQVEKLEREINKLSAEIEQVKNNKIYENAFEWRFEFPEVLDDEGNFIGFDVVIGNPPYIRQEDLADVKPYLLDHYTTAAGTADLYVYFVEQGMKLLREQGEFTYILPNKWMRAGYGKNLRSFVKNTRINRILDFGDLPVFEEATTYPAILELTKADASAEFEALNLTHLDFEPSLSAFVKNQKMTVLTDELADQGWTLTDSKIQKLLAKIRSQGKPLGEYVEGKIYRGVLTGLNEAFVIDQKTKDRLIDEDPNSAEIIKPFLAGRDIKRYKEPYIDKFLIFTRRGIDIENYPAVLRYLEQYREKLEPKPKDFKGMWAGRKPGTYKWYEIQDAVDYYQEFEKEKIIYPNICKRPEFTYDNAQSYTNQKCFIITKFNMTFLGILNSRLTFFLFKSILPMLRGDFYEPGYVYFKDFPIVDQVNSHIERIVNQILSIKKENPDADTSALEFEIDQLVYELYELTEEEIAIIKGSVNI